MVRYVILAMLITPYLCSVSLPRENARHVVPAGVRLARRPRSFSECAGELGDPQSLKEWETLQAEMEEFGIAQSKPVLPRLQRKLKSDKWVAWMCMSLHPRDSVLRRRQSTHPHPRGGFCLHSSKSTYTNAYLLLTSLG